MFILYDFLYIVFVALYAPVFLLRRKYHRGFLMRLGFFPQRIIEQLKRKQVIWLHAVSVGEAQATSYLVEHLKKAYPGFILVVSTVTETGNRIAQRQLGSEGVVIYAPLDIEAIVNKVIKLISPQIFIVAETEIWPNLVFYLAQKNVPVVLINGRISTRSFNGYRLIRPFLKAILARFSLFCMQTESDAQRIINLGADEDKVKVTGNMKFDIELSAVSCQPSALGLANGECLFIAGSTHRGEEKIILRAYKELIKKYHNLRLLIAPRHIKRVGEIEKLIAKFGFKTQRVSQFNSDQRPKTPPSPRLRRAGKDQKLILLLDSIGQLKNLYALADIVFIGGSLIPHGGQNPIEPAILNKVILFGPHMFNFSNIAQSFLSKKAAVMIKDVDQLLNWCIRLLASPGLREDFGKNARQTVLENQGVTLRNLELIKEVLPQRVLSIT